MDEKREEINGQGNALSLSPRCKPVLKGVEVVSLLARVLMQNS